MADTLIREEQVAEYVTVLTLDRPEVQNAFNLEMLGMLEQILDRLQSSDVRALMLTGTGRAFSAGADLKQIQTFDEAKAREFSLRGHQVFRKIERFPAPVIAAVNGYALGGGCELACACDLRYAAESAKLGQPESRVGMITGWGGTFRLPGIVGPAKAKEMVFTARLLSATEAREVGLVNAVFPDEGFLDRVTEVASSIAERAPIANALSKRMLNRYPGDVQAMINEESLALAYCVTTEDQTEGINAFLEKRSPTFQNK